MPSDLGAQCNAIVEKGEAFLRGDQASTAAETSALRSVRDGLGPCRNPEVAPETRARLLLIASKVGETNQPERAQVLLEEANGILSAEAPRARERVLVLEGLSSNRFALAQYGVAQTHLEEALRLREDLWGASSAEVLDGRIALVYFELAKAGALSQPEPLDQALAEAQATLETSRKRFGEDASVTTRAWAAYSAVLRESGQAERAQQLFEQHVSPQLAHLDEPLREVPQPGRP